MSNPLRRRLLSSLAAGLLTCLAAESTAAASLSLSDSPLFLATGVKPNLIMAIDDSGSMDFEVLLRANDGAAWWRTSADNSGSCDKSTGNSFTGCSADGTTDLVANGVLNFNNSGNAQSPWKKFAYLFPNGANSANNSDQRRAGDGDNDHYAIPPLPAYAWSRSPDFNTAYFNPAVTYKPWTSQGELKFTDADKTKTRWDPVYSTSGKTLDLTADFAGTGSVATGNACGTSFPSNDTNYYFRVFVGMQIPSGTCIYPVTGSNSTQKWQVVQSSGCTVDTANGCLVLAAGDSSNTKYKLASNTSVAFRYFPATFYLKTTTTLPTGFGYTAHPITGKAPDGTNLNGYEIKSANFITTAAYTAAIQNFANWFQYYRKRHQALRAGLGAAFQDVKGTRVAGFTMNGNSDATKPDVTMQDIDDDANRNSLYTQFYKNWTGSGGTPSRSALANLVRNFKRTNDGAPITAACQQNFGMLFTDGFANPPAEGDGFYTGKNVDGDFKVPYKDNTSGTMADGIMDAYANVLRSDFTKGRVTIPAACGTANADPSLDCNKNLHMNFFAITLGTRGLQFNSDNPIDPYTANPAITWPSGDQLSKTRNPVAVDDLWHATLNGRGALLNAKSPADVASELKSVLSSIAARNAASAAVAVTGGSLTPGARSFLPSFNTNGWSGDVVSIAITADGLDSKDSWFASEHMPAPASRQIYTVGGDGKSMMFDAASVNADATRLAQLQQDATTAYDDKVAYLRGDQSKEQQHGGKFRNRTSALGDVVDSAPVFSGNPALLYRDNLESVAYSKFRKEQLGRKQAVYAGANDGMLHAFYGDGGAEIFAFIPSTVFNNLYKLTQPTYTHHYYVDGSPAVIDAFYNGAWHTVLAEGLGAGGQAVFALEVTKPDSYAFGSNATPFMWEFTDAKDADLGYTYGKPQIVRLHNGKWVVLLGNGYNNTVADGNASTSGNAVLFILDAQTGALIRKIDTKVGTAQDPTTQSRPNGLSTPVTTDFDGDSIVDYVYAGDLFGNLWKFDLTNTDADEWGSPYGTSDAPKPLFTAKNGETDAKKRVQPITTRPVVIPGLHGNGLIVLFGTGKYLELADTNKANLVTQSFYGIFDPNTNKDSDLVTTRDQLTRQTVLIEGTQEYTIDDKIVSRRYRATSHTDVGSSRGWYIDLVSPSGFQGEMQVSDAKVSNGRVIFSTLIPNADPCSGGGSSWPMVMDAFSGSRLDTSPFDLNGDGQFDSKDYVSLSDGTKVPATAIGQDSIQSSPTVMSSNDTASSGGGSDLLIFNGSDGTPTVMKFNPGPRSVGRQSWRQVR